MQDLNLFEFMASQYASQLPFVVYRKPNEGLITGLFQKDKTLYTSTDFTETGFIFAPFDETSQSIFLPLEHCVHLQTEYVCSELPNENTAVTERINSADIQDHYQELVGRAIQAIQNNTFHKVVLSREEVVKLNHFNLVSVFKKLLDTYSRAMVYCWFHPEVGLWFGATPETLVKIEGQHLLTMALAGTQKYTGSIDVNWGEKEIEEQRYVTDFIQKELQAEVISVRTSKVKTVRAGALLHLQTEVSARLKPDSKVLKIVKALHPTPAVCGFPKAQAKAFILENEGYNRSFYTGYLGELNFKALQTRNTNRRNVENNAYGTVKSKTSLYVNLRCMQIEKEFAKVYVGGGITKDSNPEAEFLETVHKTSTMKKVLME